MNVTFISNVILEPYWSEYIKDSLNPITHNITSEYIAYGELWDYVNNIKSTEIIAVCLNINALYPNLSVDVISGELTYENIEKDCIQKCTQLYSTIKAHTDAFVIWFGFEDYFYVQSNICGTIQPFSGLVDKINLSLSNILKDASFIDFKRLIASMGTVQAYSPKGKYRWNAPYSKGLILLMAEEVRKQYYINSGITKKCIVLDCDNVLWGGILSDDGIEGIRISASGSGKTFQDFQQYLLYLYYNGAILAVCSKNDEADVLKVFREHSDMLLREEHIAVFKCNWDNKPSNIIRISEYLNIGLNSMVFVDDSDFEIESVKSTLPEIITIKYNRNTIYEQLSCFNLKGNMNIDVIRERNTTYKTNALRNELESACSSFDEYIQSLNMHVDIHPSLLSELSRLSELTLRTNKCTNGKRYTLEQLKTIIYDDSYALYTVYLSDRFSSLGLVGIFGIKSNVLDLFSLSCRALGRGIEDKMLEFICNMGAFNVDYKSTGKNEDIHIKLLERLQPLDT